MTTKPENLDMSGGCVYERPSDGAIRDGDLSEVLALLEKATPGPWVAGEWFVVGDIKNSTLHQSPDVCREVSQEDASAIAGAVNFLRGRGRSSVDAGEKAVGDWPTKAMVELAEAAYREAMTGMGLALPEWSSLAPMRHALRTVATPPSPASRSVGGDWLPIESAPKDRAVLLAAFHITDVEGGPSIWSGRWDDFMEYFRSCNDYCPLWDVTHWQPLPAPSIAGVSEGKDE